MTNPYTPTTEEVRAGWQKFSAWKRVPTSGAEQSGADFDRWLSAHDAELTAKADLRGFNRGYGQANREWQLSGDGRGMV